MDLQKRRTFIISFIYFAIIGVICYILFKRLIPMLMPFIMALAIAAALDPAVSYLGSRMKGGYRCAAAAVLLLFYGCLFSLAAVSGNWLFSCIQEQGRKLPALYGEVMEPGLSRFFTLLEASFPGHSIHISSLGTSLEHAMENAAGALSSSLISYGASVLVGFPSLLVDILAAVIESYFLTGSYRQTASFLMRQIPDKQRSILTAAWASIRQVTGRLVKAYALLMALTFAELFVGFWVLGVPMGFTAACLITLVDILPVLGTGTVLLPWAFIAWTTGSGSLGIGLVCLYLLITVVRQTLEPKVVGLQMGLPPAAALLCMFVGGKVLGLAGIFLFPIGATVLFELSEDGTIQLFK